jgi:hypothetical protein
MENSFLQKCELGIFTLPELFLSILLTVGDRRGTLGHTRVAPQALVHSSFAIRGKRGRGAQRMHFMEEPNVA